MTVFVYCGVKKMLEDELPGVYVHSIMIGSNTLVDTESGFFRDTNRQIAEVSSKEISVERLD
jgi:hypothetical protein